MTTDIQNLKSFDPFAEADDTGGESKTSQQNYIHIRIQRKCCPLRSFHKRSRLPVPSVPTATFVGLVLRQADANPAQSAMVAKP
jgi:hypothetical protein